MARRGLTEQVVVEAAGRLADRDGLGAVSIAAVAADLGVRPPSLYNHVPSLEALVTLIGIRALTDVTNRLALAAAGRAGDDALLAIAAAQRDFALEHPGAYAAVDRARGEDRERLRAAAVPVLEVLFAVLRGYGLEGDEAVHAARAVRSTVHGFVVLELAGGYAIDVDVEASFRWTVMTLAAGLRARAAPGRP